MIRPICVLVLTLFCLLSPPIRQSAEAETCAERAERFKAAIQTDIRKRQIAEGVAKSLLPDVEKAEGLCKTGKTAEGEKILNKIMKTYGYR